MNILIIDSTKDSLDIVLKKDGQSLSLTNNDGRFRHSEILLQCIDKLLKDAGLAICDIDIFGAVVGPGSFTGIRVGLSTIKALSYALNRDTVSVNSLRLLAYNEKIKHNVLAVINASHGSYYACKFDSNKCDGECMHISASELANFAKAGVTLCSNTQIDGLEVNVYPNTADNLLNAIDDILKDNIKELIPFYAELSQAEKMKK